MVGSRSRTAYRQMAYTQHELCFRLRVVQQSSILGAHDMCGTRPSATGTVLLQCASSAHTQPSPRIDPGKASAPPQIYTHAHTHTHGTAHSMHRAASLARSACAGMSTQSRLMGIACVALRQREGRALHVHVCMCVCIHGELRLTSAQQVHTKSAQQHSKPSVCLSVCLCTSCQALTCRGLGKGAHSRQPHSWLYPLWRHSNTHHGAIVKNGDGASLDALGEYAPHTVAPHITICASRCAVKRHIWVVPVDGVGVVWSFSCSARMAPESLCEEERSCAVCGRTCCRGRQQGCPACT